MGTACLLMEGTKPLIRRYVKLSPTHYTRRIGQLTDQVIGKLVGVVPLNRKFAQHGSKTVERWGVR